MYILQGYNFDPTLDYDIYWDDFTWNDTYTTLDCEGQIAYTYLYADCADATFAWTYTYTIERTTTPDEVGTVDNSSTVYGIADATAPTTLPLVNDVCGNELSPTVASPLPVDVITNCTGTRTYTYNYVDCAGLTYSWIYTYTLATSTLSGTMVYNNPSQTLMKGVKLELFNSSDVSMGTFTTETGGAILIL